jgi:outer membrane protein OmpA-like peptidoglycan-associated protein/predicted small lipoprotein YifL
MARRMMLTAALLAALAGCGKKADTGAANTAANAAPAAAPDATPAVQPSASAVPTDRSKDKAGCADPAWAPARVVGYRLDNCEDKAWASYDVSLPEGKDQMVWGHRTAVTYRIDSGADHFPSAAVRQVFVNQALKAGARLVSRPDSYYEADLVKSTPQGDLWMLFTHGDGNSDVTGSYTLTTVQVMPLPQEVVAKPMPAPLDPKDHVCGDPPWLVKQFAYFKVDSCEKKAWDTADYSLPGGQKTLTGERVSVTYSLTDESKNPTAAAVAKNYANALEKIGAKLVTPNDAGYQVVLNQQTPFGLYWYVYDHGSGNSDYTSSYTLTTWLEGPPPQEVQAKAMQGPLAPAGKPCANPPWLVKQFDYFKIDACSYRDFDSVDIDLPGGKKTVAGQVLETNYVLSDPVRDPVALLVKKNYVNALTAIGAKELDDPTGVYNAVMHQQTAQGEFWYLLYHTVGNSGSTGAYQLVTVHVGPPPVKTCTLEVYGVNFDFDKSTLRPDSEPVLNSVLAMLQADPSYSGEVGGHTDNIGSEPYNLKLSGARADAVRAWLVAHGVAPARLTSRGYGDTKPLVPNTTDAGRAKNRRVELKRNNCR